MADVFISYSKTRPDLTAALARDLEAAGYSVWWDTGLLPNQVFRREIDLQLDTCKAAIIVWTPESVESEWVVAEADHAWQARKLVNTHSPDLDPKRIPKPFNQIHSVSISDRAAIRSTIDSIAKGHVHAPVAGGSPQPFTRGNRQKLVVAAGALAALALVIGVATVRDWSGVMRRPVVVQPDAATDSLPSLVQIRREKFPVQNVDWAIPIGKDEGYNYSALVHATVSFRTAAFNQVSYLGSLADVRIPALADSGTEASLLPIGQQENARIATIGQVRSLAFAFRIKSKDRPAETDSFAVEAGPLRWQVRFGKLAWKEYRRAPGRAFEKDRWHGSFAEVALKANDPDWILVHHARLLPGAAADGNAADSLLEVVIENRSPASLALSAIELSAAQRRRKRCYCPDCKPAEMQKVVLNWTGILARNSAASDAPAWTVINNRRLAVSAQFRPETCSNATEFNALIPVSQAVAPKSMIRVHIALQEMAATFPALAQWDRLAVAIAPADSAFPKRTRVALPKAAAQ